MNRAGHERECSDVELVRRAQRGSPAAFAELVNRYQDRVFNTCFRMCRHEADALDLTQTTFLRALEALHTFREKAGFYTWLFRIAVNLTISQRRRQKHQPRVSLDQPAAEHHPALQLPGSEPPVAATAELHEEHARVADALRRLDEEFRAAVVLKDVEGMDYATIAEILAVPVGTVKSRIHRGRMMLREMLSRGCDST